jgi:isoleucyl-tRNA synthetase
MYLEGSDQHRGWFHSSLLTSCMTDGIAPYKGLLTHGFVVDGEGRKMSKSKGNVVAPQKVSSSLGAEILRLWVASTDYSGELFISDEILKRVVESYRRIRNTLRFLLANTSDFDAGKDAVPVAGMLEIDRYALALTARLQAGMAADYAGYQFHVASQKLQAFCSEDLGGFYLDVLKDRLYTCPAQSHARRSAQTALWHITHSLVRLMAPVLSFTAEELWSVFSGKADDSVFFQTWHELPQVEGAEEAVAKWHRLRELRSAARKQIEELRVAGKVGSSLQAEVDFHAAGEDYLALASLGDELRFLMLTSAARLHRSNELKVEVAPSAHPKCERCWHYRADVNAEGLCGRCVSNLSGPGESRRHA